MKLKCNHVFNYKYILKEVLSQRKKNSLETQRLKKYEIKCPYCRTIQVGLLPYKFGEEKIHNVNWPLSQCLFTNKCGFFIKRGKRKGNFCNKDCFYKLCKKHLKDSKIKRCQYVLTKGKNKGNKCSFKEIKNGYCKRHIKIIEKNT